MAINYRPSWDKPTRKIIISQLEKLCLNCGGFFVRGSCIRCKGTRFVEVMEHEAAAWRAEIAEANRIANKQSLLNACATARVLAELDEAEGYRRLLDAITTGEYEGASDE